jgi:exopolysaccharide production protein ExoQ
MLALTIDYGFVQPTVPLPRPVPMAASGSPAQWSLCFISIVMLLVQQWASASVPGAQMVVVAIFILSAFLLAVRQPALAFGSVLKNWPLLALPLLAVLSTLWSAYPQATFKGALEYAITMVVGTVLAACVKPRSFLSALLSALALVTLIGVLFGVRRFINGELILEGLFGSKNYFGIAVSLLLLTGLAVAFDSAQARVFRYLAFASILSAPPLLVYSRSTGALVVSAATVGLTWLVSSIARFPPQVRMACVLVAVPCTVFAALGWIYLGDFTSVLDFFGKDVTLSGRTNLWQQATASIEEQPILGVGYDAYWQIGSWGAENAWRMFGITAKSGFHFHNMFLQVAVDLGVVGLFVFTATLIWVLVRTARTVLYLRPGAEQMFAIAVLIYTLLRTPIEVGLFSQFQLESMLLCLTWIYLEAPRRPSLLMRRRASRSLSDSPEAAEMALSWAKSSDRSHQMGDWRPWH